MRIRNKQVSLLIAPNLYAKAMGQCAYEGRSFNALVRYLIAQYVNMAKPDIPFTKFVPSRVTKFDEFGGGF